MSSDDFDREAQPLADLGDEREQLGEEGAVNVSLTPELEELIQERVRSGRYTSASEVVREVLRLLQDRNELRRLRIAELRTKSRLGWTPSTVARPAMAMR